MFLTFIICYTSHLQEALSSSVNGFFTFVVVFGPLCICACSHNMVSCMGLGHTPCTSLHCSSHSTHCWEHWIFSLPPYQHLGCNLVSLDYLGFELAFKINIECSSADTKLKNIDKRTWKDAVVNHFLRPYSVQWKQSGLLKMEQSRIDVEV